MSGEEPTQDPARRWEQVQALFHAAADLPAAERDAYLASACAGDAALAARVRALLAADAEGNALLEGGIAAAAGGVLGTPAVLAGRTFGPYRATGVLGEGGMGVVLRGRREDLGSEAAIKVLRDASLSPARRERFAFEQRALAQLTHPSIARLYDADVLADGTPWFAMELVDGEPLNDYCRTRALDVPARLRLFRDVCEAVQHAHEHAILHRDLKPSNILVRPDGRVTLLDFGIAKPLDPIDDPADATRTGLRLMTPAYAAPEQVLGGPLGVRTDVYSLGVVLYELLAGALPFDLAGRTPSEAATVLAEHAPRRPSVVARETAPHAHGPGHGAWNDLDVMCLTAMHRDPERRYATVDALVRDIDRYLAGEPLEARGDSFRYRAGKFLRRHARAVAAAALVLATLVAVVTFYTLRLAAARDVARAESARKQLIQQFMTEMVQGDPEAGPSDTLRVVTMIGKGEDEARRLANQPALRGELERTLGGLEQAMGRLDRADTLLASALEHARRAPDADPADVVRSVVALAILRSDEARHDEAERLAREALELATHADRRDPALEAEATATLGRVLVARGANAPAVPVLERSLALYRAAGTLESDGASTITDLANAKFYLGDFRASDSLNRVGLAIDRARYGPRHPNVADDLINLGQIECQAGRYAQGERDFREALGITRAWYGDRHPETASALTMVARVLNDQGRYEEAAALLPEALAVEERVYGPSHPRVAGTLSAMGDVALSRDRYDEALAAYRRAADIYRTTRGDHDGQLGIVLANLGSVELQRTDAPAAERWFRAALDAYHGALPDDHVDVGVTRIKLGRALLRQRRYTEAERESLTGYRILSRQTVPGIGFLRAARKDLVADYEALGRPAEAARFRAELADTTASH